VSTDRAASRTAGFTLLEMLIATTVLGVALVTLLGLHARNIRLVAEAQDLVQATLLASCLATLTRTVPAPELGVTQGDFSERDPVLQERCHTRESARFRWEREIATIGGIGSALANLRRVIISVGTRERPGLARLKLLVRRTETQ
jgi:prepilin-type N-terminal cleavage/methylation domain-containing protein